MPIGISIHYGGKFTFDQNGAHYSKPPVNTVWVDENLSFEQLQSLIYEASGYNRNRWNLEIMARILHAGRYLRIALGDEGALRGLIAQVLMSGQSFLEVYACRICGESRAGSSSQNSVEEHY